MSDMAKEARKAMKAKAQRLGGDRPTEKVDSSTWTPPSMLNADVKTGLRPISRRAYKSGGKVSGEDAKACMTRKPRQSGGKAITADSLINKNVKEANEQREGVKHVGALKTGGRAKKMIGGPSMGPVAGANQMMQNAQMTGGVPSSMLNFAPGIKKGTLSPLRAAGMKKGGKTEGHPDEAADKALIKKMVKPEARTGKKHGGERMARKEGGKVFSGPGYPGKVPGAVPGGRTAHAAGGKAGKGKTDINIMIGAHHPGAGASPMGVPPVDPMGGTTKPPGMGGPAGGAPLPPPGMPMGMPPGMPMGMPPGMPPVGGAPGMPPIPPGMMPKPRKAGGRTYKSYKDMDAGAANGFGRLEKAEIASKTARIEKGNY